MIQILNTTTKNPISLMGERAGICTDADIIDPQKNYKRGLDCIKSNHGRVLEFVNVEIVIDGYSARVIREWYTHIGGAPTRLQASTRYIDYSDFTFINPFSNTSDHGKYMDFQAAAYQIKAIIKDMYDKYEDDREDVAMLLPICMGTKIVDKRNLRSLVDMSHQRLCNRAYKEFRDLLHDLYDALSEYSDEWKEIIDLLMKPKCEVLGYCPERRSCGKMKGLVE